MVLTVVVRPADVRSICQILHYAHTFDAATCSVKPAIGIGVLFDTRELIKRTVSLSLDTLKRTFMLVLVTVSSLLVSGTEEAKVHSSSSSTAAALVLLCAKFDVGASRAPPSRSTMPEAGGGGFTDCWYWKGDPVREVVAKAAKGSGDRMG